MLSQQCNGFFGTFKFTINLLCYSLQPVVEWLKHMFFVYKFFRLNSISILILYITNFIFTINNNNSNILFCSLYFFTLHIKQHMLLLLVHHQKLLRNILIDSCILKIKIGDSLQVYLQAYNKNHLVKYILLKCITNHV